MVTTAHQSLVSVGVADVPAQRVRPEPGESIGNDGVHAEADQLRGARGHRSHRGITSFEARRPSWERRGPPRATFRGSGPPGVDSYGVETVDLDDFVFADEVKVLTAGGLSALCSPDTHHFDGPRTIDHPIAGPDAARGCDLSWET